jgi:hypothetical protein
MDIKKVVALCMVVVAIALGEERTRWYTLHFELNTGNTSEFGIGSGVFWSRQKMDIPPCDAFGFSAGAALLINKTETIPVVRIDAGANWNFFCFSLRYSRYFSSVSGDVSSLNPQIGVTWMSIVNMYVGYDKPLFNRTLPGLGGINMSVSMNVPTYCLK